MSRRVNLIPMAGAGRRFAEAGYTIPKPLIPIAGKPMVVRAAECLPPADLWIFVCREAHIREAGIAARLAEHFSPLEVISVEELTEGQACTCLLARSLLRAGDRLTIGASDNAMTYERSRFEQLALAPDFGACIWTFRGHPAVLANPRMYGWVETHGQNRARRVSVKIPISENPLADHAVIGAFSFRRAEDFLSCADRAIACNRRVNQEFYMDEVMNVVIESGLAVCAFEVDRYIGWGTPRDLETYLYWREYFLQEESGGRKTG